jgi:hypothetical protein
MPEFKPTDPVFHLITCEEGTVKALYYDAHGLQHL